MSNAHLIDKPWLVKIELTRGCNLRCKFCPVHSQPAFQGAQDFLTPALADEIGRQLGAWVPEARLEFTMRGEPTLNPQAAECIAALREHLPRSQFSMFTNGTTWLKDDSVAEAMLDAGINIFNVDCYNNTYDRFHTKALEVGMRRPDIDIADFREFSAYRKQKRGHAIKVINLVPDIADPAQLVKVRKVHNMAGNLSDEQEQRFGISREALPLAKGCARPFRELTTTWDGKILICCLDWREQGYLGTVEQGIQEVWYGDEHLAILRALYSKERTGAPCDVCTYNGGVRLGLLRDPYTGIKP